MTTVDEARVATRDEGDVVTELIVGAFYEDPTWSWAFPDPDLRRAQHRRFWRAYVDGAMRFPWVWLTAGDTAASFWIPPGERELTEQQEEAVEQLLEELLGADAQRVLRAFELFEEKHPRNEPHFYLSLLATDPQHRGRGDGLGLLAANLAAIDAAAMPAYLEASNPANVPLYERYGFRVVGAFDLPDGGPRVHTMWREGASISWRHAAPRGDRRRLAGNLSDLRRDRQRRDDVRLPGRAVLGRGQVTLDARTAVAQRCRGRRRNRRRYGDHGTQPTGAGFTHRHRELHGRPRDAQPWSRQGARQRHAAVGGRAGIPRGSVQRRRGDQPRRGAPVAVTRFRDHRHGPRSFPSRRWQLRRSARDVPATRLSPI